MIANRCNKEYNADVHIYKSDAMEMARAYKFRIYPDAPASYISALDAALSDRLDREDYLLKLKDKYATLSSRPIKEQMKMEAAIAMMGSGHERGGSAQEHKPRGSPWQCREAAVRKGSRD